MGWSYLTWELLFWGLLSSALVSIATLPSVLLRRQGRPAAALSWILVLVTLPFVGLLAWWFFGRIYLKSRKRKRYKTNQTVESALLETRAKTLPHPQVSPSLLILENLPSELQENIFPPSGENHVRLISGAPAAYDAWEAAIKNARHHVHFLFYSWRSNESGQRFLKLLTKCAEDGLEVRALYDPVGSPFMTRRFLKPLRQAGAQVRSFTAARLRSWTPALNFRNHRKILIVDGRVAFIGGINIGDEYLTWHDLAVEMRGPSVDQVQEVFSDDWFFSGGENLCDVRYYGQWSSPYHPSETSSDFAKGVSCATLASGPVQRFNAMSEMLFAAITRAQERVWIMTPYFIPNQALSAALRSAVYRGVDVQIMLPAKSDVPFVRRASWAFYPSLLRSGIRIFEYLPGMLHAKAVIFDTEMCFIGSANMDIRSFRLNFEISVLFGSKDLNETLAEFYQRDRAQSVEISLEETLSRSWRSRVLDAAAHLFSPLL